MWSQQNAMGFVLLFENGNTDKVFDAKYDFDLKNMRIKGSESPSLKVVIEPKG